MKTTSLSVRQTHLLAIALSIASCFVHKSSNGQSKTGQSIAYADDGEKNRNGSSFVQTRDVILIQNNNKMFGIAKLYSTSGKKLTETILQSAANTIDISMLPRGEYIICVTLDGGQTFNQKFTRE